MTKNISSKIVGFKVKSNDVETEVVPVVHKSLERVKRPEVLSGSTYKLKPPEHVSAHALYITINNYVINEGTDREEVRPFEIFVNSKSMENFQWIVALTRVMSAVFRTGVDSAFLVEELHSVFDPKGGHWTKGKFVPSLIAEVGSVLEKHFVSIGVITPEVPDEAQQVFIAEKLAEFSSESVTDSPYPAEAVVCEKCKEKAVVHRDGCTICLACADSKCG